MQVSNPAELRAALAPGTRLLGLDLGEKTIGLASGNPAIGLATPLQTLARGRFADAAAALKAVIAKECIGGLVIGLPRNMDGSEGPRAQATRAFARNLLAMIDLPLLFWDERLSTQAVERAMIDADVSRAKRAARVDSAAAAFILQGVLDALR